VTRLARICDNMAVGVVIRNRDGQYLAFRRATYPAGYALAESHVDGGRGFEAVADAVMGRKSGLDLTGLTLAWNGWRDNACDRRPGREGIGHEWRVFRGQVTGWLRADPATSPARLVTGSQLQQLANRTALYARGRLSDAEFAGRPGLEAVWVRFLHEMGLVVMTARDLTLTDQLAARPAPGDTR
jgi:hypothetical protein